MKIQIVADLTFGDGGKGVVTDNLAAAGPKGETLVVRYTGGPQAAHTVMRDGKKHIFSSFGSGTLAGVPTFFSKHTLIYLPNMLRELEVLRSLGVEPTLHVDPFARLITPYDIAFNRARETSHRHGSCGKGIGATMKRHEETPHKLYAVDLLNMNMLQHKLDHIAGYYDRMVGNLAYEERQLNHPCPISKSLYVAERDKEVMDYIEAGVSYITGDLPFQLTNWWDMQNTVPDNGTIIFEGAQGILLDMDHGYFPHVTYGYTTTRNAWEMIPNEWWLRNVPEVWYVTRCYQTRHGYGPMSNNTAVELVNTDEEINVTNPWQNDFRIAELDYELLKLGWSMDMPYYPPTHVHKHIVFTCLDQRPGWEIDYSQVPETFSVLKNDSPEAGHMSRVLRRSPEIMEGDVQRK